MKCETSQDSGKPVTDQQHQEPAPARPPARSAKRAAGGSAGAERDTPSSNTVSPSYNGEGKVKILFKGIDSLYLSYQGEMDPQISWEIANRKLFAQSRKAEDQAKAQWEVGAHLFEVADKGQRSGTSGGFAYILEDAAYRIALSASGSRALPLAYVKVSSAYLAHQRPEAIVKELSAIIETFGVVDPPSLSRVDLFVDFQSEFEMEDFRRECWVTRAGGFDTHARMGQFTGYSIGLGGAIGGRLYNKTLEIKKSKKTYFDELWQRGGADPSRPIWRLEFEVSREILNELRILNFDGLMRNQGGIWAYATQTWLRLTEPRQGDSNRARWPTHPLWQALSEVRWRLDDEPLIRRFSTARTPAEGRLCRFLISYITSYMALHRIIDYEEGVRKFLESARSLQENHCAMRLEIGFDEWVAQQVAVKAKRFNLKIAPWTARDEVDMSADEESAAIAYYKASRGE